MTLFEVYKDSIKKLDNTDTEEINVRILLCEINHLKSMSDFYIHKDEEIQDLQRFNELLARFLNGEPVQYILGKTTFLRNEFLVDRRVLIPRQESEEVVAFAIQKIKEKFDTQPVDIFDVCCGSGIMGISLAKSVPTKSLILSDISREAIEVTKTNLAKLNIDGETIVGDGLNTLISEGKKCDVLISNPPYILKGEIVDESVLENEPHLALFADNNFSIYKSIISNLDIIKKEKIIAVFEIGENTRNVIEPYLLENFPSYHFEFVKDINEEERILYIYIE